MARNARGRTRAFVLAALVAVLVAAVVARSTIEAQARAFVVVASVADFPALSWVATHATGEPRVTDARVAGTPATIARPAGSGPWPAMVLLNGATRLGRREEGIRALAEGFARAGYLVVIPDLPGLRRGEITRRTLRATVAVAEATARGHKIALFGMSTGGSLALLAAEDPAVARRVQVVAAMGSFADIRAGLRLATTHTYRDRDRMVDFTPRPFLALGMGRSVIAALPPGANRERLLEALADADPAARDPLFALRAISQAQLRRPARAVVALLSNRDPRRFDDLYAALPAAVRDTCRVLSPASAARRLRAPVLLAADPRDAYFPPTHARELASAAPEGTVTIVRTASHSAPHGVGDALRLDWFLVRTLELAD